MESMSLHSLTVISQDEIEIIFVGDDGVLISHRFYFSSEGLQDQRIDELQGVNGDAEFQSKYRRVPGPITPLWPERLAHAARNALKSPLPAGRALEGLREEVLNKLTEDFNARREK